MLMRVFFLLLVLLYAFGIGLMLLVLDKLASLKARTDRLEKAAWLQAHGWTPHAQGDLTLWTDPSSGKEMPFAEAVFFQEARLREPS